MGLLGTSDISPPVCLYYRKPAVMTLTGTDALSSLFFILKKKKVLQEIEQSKGTTSCWRWHRMRKMWSTGHICSRRSGNKSVNAWKPRQCVQREEIFLIYVLRWHCKPLALVCSHHGVAITDSQYPRRIPLHFLGFKTTSSNPVQLHFKLSVWHWATQDYFKMFESLKVNAMWKSRAFGGFIHSAPVSLY